METKRLMLFAYNILIEGCDKSAIYNLQKSKVFFVPHKALEIIKVLTSNDYEDVRKTFSEDLTTMEKYTNFLIDHDLAFWTNHPECFPPLNLGYASPNLIDCCLIDYNENLDYTQTVIDLDHLNCKVIEIRVATKLASFDSLRRLLNLIKPSTVRSLNLFFEYNVLDRLNELKQIVEENAKISYLALFDSGYYARENFENCEIVFIDKKITEIKLSDDIHQKFTINYQYFFESLVYNPVLKGKVSITRDGEIKNISSDMESFGNISSNSVIDICRSNLFQTKWRRVKTNSQKKPADFYCISGYH